MEGNPTAENAEERVAKIPYWYHRFEIAPGVVTPGVYRITGALANMHLPDDMSAMAVLEIGPADGAFTKAMWERGAMVTAVDYMPRAGFNLMREITGCNAQFVHGNVLEIDQLGLGLFDLIVFMGVLYHFPDPFRTLWRLRSMLKPEGTLILETLVSLQAGAPIMEYLPAGSSNNDITNFWAPNAACCRAMLVDCGYTVEREVAPEGHTRAIWHAKINAAPKAEEKARRAYSLRQA